MLSRDTIFRGVTDGDRIGPYISQFLYQPFHRNTDIRTKTTYNEVYLTDYDSWLEAQDGKKIDVHDDLELPKTNVRHILTPRDLAYYVHVDAFVSSVSRYCLILLNTENDMVPPQKVYHLNPLLPYQNSSKQMGFAVFGGPQILSLVTEVATQALKAVWFQKWGVHRRLRPEALGGLIHRHYIPPRQVQHLALQNLILPMKRRSMVIYLAKLVQIKSWKKFDLTYGSYLLPQAFPEGSPTHPSYGAGHATVAGACVTILKAWFNEDDIIFKPKRPNTAGTDIEEPPAGSLSLKVGDELNKLAANIAIGRNWAGVHYRSDYTESITLGEQIALGVLQEQATCYHKKDPFACRLTRFDGQPIKIEETQIT